MLETKFIRQNLSELKKALLNRNDKIDIDIFQECDSERKTLLVEIEQLRRRRNVVSEKIASMKKNNEDAQNIIIEMREVSGKIKNLDKAMFQNEEKINDILMRLPNMPHKSVPIGKDSSDNLIVRHVGKPLKFEFDPQAHWTIGENLGILDFNRASKITGSRFPLYFGAGAKLERALINFMLDIHTEKHGYKEVLPPFVVNRKSMTNTGQLPKFEEDLFKLEGWDYFMIPTAEVPVTNIHQDEILNGDALPIKYVAHTPCFRSEAGSYGKDTRGLIRQHQFNKVELVKFTHPENSYDELEKLLNDAETILQNLKLPYQIISLCTGDLSFASAKTYDIEVWMPAQNVYREISSCSNFESFQARRGNIKFKRQDTKKAEFLHTLNGSGLAVGRTVAAILENYQQDNGSVIIPEALRNYMKADVIA